MNYLIKLLSVNCVIAFIYGKNITLLDYGLEPSSINCTRGYASINHTILLTCLVNYSKDASIDSISHVEFRLQNVTDGSSTHFTYFDIKSKCVPMGTSTDCVTVGQDAVKITEKFNASKDYSGAHINAILFGKDRTDSIQSKTIKLPEITETSSECRFTTDSVEPMNTNGYTHFVWFLLIILLAVIVLLVWFDVSPWTVGAPQMTREPSSSIYLDNVLNRSVKKVGISFSQEKVSIKASTGRPTEDSTEIRTRGSPHFEKKQDILDTAPEPLQVNNDQDRLKQKEPTPATVFDKKGN